MSDNKEEVQRNELRGVCYHLGNQLDCQAGPRNSKGWWVTASTHQPHALPESCWKNSEGGTGVMEGNSPGGNSLGLCHMTLKPQQPGLPDGSSRVLHLDLLLHTKGRCLSITPLCQLIFPFPAPAF